MARKKYMAIHTFHSDEMKRAFFRGLHKSELTDFEWRDGYIFEKCQCTGTWVGDDDFFFCQWESENEDDELQDDEESSFEIIENTIDGKW